MKTIVLDDDPTGTQSASGVDVLLAWDADILTEALERRDSVYLLTNTRAVDEASAVDMLRGIRGDRDAAAERLGEQVHVVLRGDSTLRGHVFAETAVFTDEKSVIVFLPAFPDGGRTTVDGMHYVRVGDDTLPAHESEYADDPVFGFSTGYLPDYVSEKSGRQSIRVGLAELRADGSALRSALLDSAPGTVVLPDAETGDDVRLVASEVLAAWRDGVDIVVRSASPLAAAIAGVESVGLLPGPLVAEALPTLLICGSHTRGATKQLEPVEERFGPAVVVDTDSALADAEAAGMAAAITARTALSDRSFAAAASERTRDSTHNTLKHGEQVMRALTTLTADLRSEVRVVIAKGGITSAEIARVGLGATVAHVQGQVVTGVSVWSITTPEGVDVIYVVVPGNVGDPRTLLDVLAAVGID